MAETEFRINSDQWMELLKGVEGLRQAVVALVCATCHMKRGGGVAEHIDMSHRASEASGVEPEAGGHEQG